MSEMAWFNILSMECQFTATAKKTFKRFDLFLQSYWSGLDGKHEAHDQPCNGNERHGLITHLITLPQKFFKLKVKRKCFSESVENKYSNRCYIFKKGFDHRFDFQKGNIAPIQILKSRPFPMA
jgi:hypothetical protein